MRWQSASAVNVLKLCSLIQTSSIRNLEVASIDAWIVVRLLQKEQELSISLICSTSYAAKIKECSSSKAGCSMVNIDSYMEILSNKTRSHLYPSQDQEHHFFEKLSRMYQAQLQEQQSHCILRHLFKSWD